MKEISAAEAALHFSDVLDAVEAVRETFLVTREGKPVARMGPMATAGGAAIKELLRAHPVDEGWAEDLAELRAGLSAGCTQDGARHGSNT